MSEEDRIAAEEAAKKREDELIEQAAVAEEAKAKMTEELKDLRTAKQKVEQELEEKKGEQDPEPKDPDPEEVVERVLTRRQEAESKANKDSTLEEFKRSVKEFSPETDEAGIVFSKFEKELNKFNLNGLNTREDYMKRFKEVYEFMNREKKESTPSASFHSGTPATGGSDPGADDSANLSDAEAKLMKDIGWDKERFLATKAKRPHYVASLIKLRG